jgi:hypothetical protein
MRQVLIFTFLQGKLESLSLSATEEEGRDKV